jgi:hypothetical protein
MGLANDYTETEYTVWENNDKFPRNVWLNMTWAEDMPKLGEFPSLYLPLES